ncbi:MAG: hypothetical protein IJH71_09745 [Eubacterium sp.]|nr:hypothetical protein [Eubacterium sp.]
MRRWMTAIALCMLMTAGLFFSPSAVIKAKDQPVPVQTAALITDRASRTEKVYRPGDTWNTPEWSLTIDSVEKTDDRNIYADIEPAAVYIVTYTYENLHYTTTSKQGLCIDLTSNRIIDCKGNLGYDYPLDRPEGSLPEEIRTGQKKTAQAVIGVDYEGAFVIQVQMYNSAKKSQYKAFFSCNVSDE